MTYTFKLSRRLARLKTAGTAFIAATFVVTACTGDQTTGPESTSAGDPNTVSVAPGSVYMSPQQAMQFQASVDNLTSSSISSTSKGNGRARGRRTVVDLALVPDTLTVAEGAAASFVANATLSDGSVAQPSVTWSASGGTIDANGKYIAGPIPGGYVVMATASNGVADTATVIVTQSPPAVMGVTLSPTSASLPVGGSKRFVAMGKSNDGSTVAVSPKYAASGGTVSADGVYQAGQTPGSFRVVATDTLTQLADTAAVIIEAPSATLQAVILTPATASLITGATQQFTASGKMSDGSTSAVTVSWSASGGTISSTGLFTAGQTVSTFRVIATLVGGTLADTAQVSVMTPQGTSVPPASDTASVSAGGDVSGAVNAAVPLSGRAPAGWKIFWTTVSGPAPGQFSHEMWQASYETGDFTEWTGTAQEGSLCCGNETGDSRVSATQRHLGTRSWEAFNDNVGLEEAKLLRWRFDLNQGYYSTWFYWPTDYTMVNNPNGNFANIFQWKERQAPYNPVWVVAVQPVNGADHLVWQDIYGFGCCQDIAPLPPKGTWNHLAAYYKLGVRDGEIWLFLNGRLISKKTGLNTYGAATNQPGTPLPYVMWGIGNYGGAGVNKSIFFDDAEVSNATVDARQTSFRAGTPGTYIVRITASDGTTSVSDEATVTLH